MAITPEQKELARHRFNRAEETLKESIDTLARQSVSLSINRAYYINIHNFYNSESHKKR